MSWLSLLLLSAIAALLDTVPLSLWPVAPQAGIALAAWIGINGDDRDMLIRIWCVGLVLDAADPASQVFHSLVLPIASLLVLPLRRLLFRRSFIAWALWAAILVLVVAWIDATMVSRVTIVWRPVLAEACLTAAVVLPAGWLLNVLPEPLHPLGVRG
ncbi:MAG: hypothetical protein ACOCXA_04740 [Planctomycetota bacterium]